MKNVVTRGLQNLILYSPQQCNNPVIPLEAMVKYLLVQYSWWLYSIELPWVMKINYIYIKHGYNASVRNIAREISKRIFLFETLFLIFRLAQAAMAHKIIEQLTTYILHSNFYYTSS